jgi:hypothetical protein
MGKRGKIEASLTALAVCDLQDRIPKSRVLYSSATAATEVRNLAYCKRLGLSGRGTAFPTMKNFVEQIEGGGVAAMELVARDMKSRGILVSRSLSFDGVEYDRLVHVLSADQRAMYDKLCEGWQIALRHIHEALEIVASNSQGKVDGQAKGRALSSFWSAHQRCFGQILTAMKMPTVIAHIEGTLAAGGCAVLQLVSTQEAAMERQLAKLDEHDDLSDIDITPRDMLMQTIEHCFPVAQMESYIDMDGRERMRAALDSGGNQIFNKEAVAMREMLMTELGSISCPDGPLEMLINHFGPDNVAEVTGRRRRVVRKMVDGTEKTVIEARSATKCTAEASDFQDGKRRILIFSDAGGTGVSYHASATVSNQTRRTHYLIQAGWVADAAIQGFGRTHRSNQLVAPLYMLCSTDVLGERRFLSSIARRLDQLGALTKGQRQTGRQGIFAAADNLEGQYAREAVRQLYADLYKGRVEGVSLDEFTTQTGLVLTNKDGGLLEELPPIPRLLNRLLSMKLAEQTRLFSEFEIRIEAKMRKAALDGTLDLGVETIRATHAHKLSEQVVYTDPASSAETKHVHVRLEHAVKPVTFEELMKMEGATHWQKIEFFARNIQNGKIYAFTDAGDRTLKDGRVVPCYYQVGPTTRHSIEKSHINSPLCWDKRSYIGAVFPDPSSPGMEEHSRQRARTIWDAMVADAPKFQSEDLHLITGAVLPIWDRLKGNPRVKRLATDAGERLLGRVVEEDDLVDTLTRLGVNSDKSGYTPADVVRMLLNGSHRFELANRWSLERARVKGEPRIELVGPAYINFAELKVDGFYWERDSNYKVHVYAPTETAEYTVASLLKTKPIAKAVRVRGVGEPDLTA